MKDTTQIRIFSEGEVREAIKAGESAAKVAVSTIAYAVPDEQQEQTRKLMIASALAAITTIEESLKLEGDENGRRFS